MKKRNDKNLGKLYQSHRELAITGTNPVATAVLTENYGSPPNRLEASRGSSKQQNLTYSASGGALLRNSGSN